MRRKISIFGATGSVGQNTVDLLQRQGGAEMFEVVALSGHRNIKLLAEQARSLRAAIVVCADEKQKPELASLLAGTDTKITTGRAGLVEAASLPADWTMSAIVGAAGLEPGLIAAKNGGTLALANKESLVCAGALLMETCKAHGTTLLPVDSEHSAIFQALRGEDVNKVSRILLTASGGPFWEWPLEKMRNVTPAQAMAHPNWDMGDRISIDSATMFNKALEVIETQVLYGVSPDRIEVVIHPQSIIHSMVEFNDGAVIAQLGDADMRGPIGFALNYPAREDLPVSRLDFTQLSRLDFAPEDTQRFPALRLAREVMAAGGLCGAVFNAAKEVALDLFIVKSIGFLDMATLVAHVLDKIGPEAATQMNDFTLETVLEYDTLARVTARDLAAKL